MPDAVAEAPSAAPLTQRAAQRRLALLWFSGFGLLFLVMAIQVVAGRYAEGDTSRVVGWFFPTTIPVSTLMVGVLVAQALSGAGEERAADVFVYRLALTMLAVYLVLVGLTIVYATVFSVRPLPVYERSNYVLGPAQGLVTATLGAFFARQAK